MSSPFVRRSAVLTAGAAVLAGLVATPIAAFADTGPALDPIPAGIPSDAVVASADPDGAGTLFTLTQDFTTTSTITMPNDATLAGAGHTITAVEDADHANFPGAVLASAVGTAAAPAGLDVTNLHITTQGFQGDGKNSGGLLAGISMYRAGGSLTDVSVNGVSHGNGVQEGTAISIRNRVSGDDIDVPRAHVHARRRPGLEVPEGRPAARRKPGVRRQDAHVGQGSGPEGQPNPTIAANSLQVSRGASGTVKRTAPSRSTATRRRPESCSTTRGEVAFERCRRRTVTPPPRAVCPSGQHLEHDRDRVHHAGRIGDSHGDPRGRHRRHRRRPGGLGLRHPDRTPRSPVGMHRSPVRSPAGRHGRRDRRVPGDASRDPSPARRAAGVRARGRPGRGQAAALESSRSTATAAPPSVSTPARRTSGPSGSARAPAPTRSRSSRTA